ncbi:MAG: agmatinase [Vicinamibacteria bacterium]|nr:agmatinase [Vicinamibacteria bacterium]
MLGLPTDVNSSHLRGAALGPGAIRGALWSGASNLTSEVGVDLGAPGVLRDEGDLSLHEAPADRERIEKAVGGLLDRGFKPLLLGGDHSVTYPVIRAFATRHPGLSILHFDAHPDLYDEYEGNRFSHACPFARIMEEGLARRLVQVGIRTLNAHQAAQARRFGVEMVTMAAFDADAVPIPRGPLYITIDLDALDPAFAPGVAHREPGGLSVRDMIRILHRVRSRVVGADIVELRPASDRDGVTAVVAAKLLKEVAGLLRA